VIVQLFRQLQARLQMLDGAGVIASI
jgi:hypothetical protein